jgi:hypothetical protein
MAAATLSSAHIDLKAKDTYPIRLGSSILKPKEAKKFTSVRYNHKPVLKGSQSVQASVRSSKNSAQEELVLKDREDEYKYAGQNVGSGDRYVLLSRKNGNDKELILEKLAGCHEFNLVKTSTESGTTKPTAKLPQLSFEEDANNDLFGDGEDDEVPVDSSNPWDYRNYLKSGTSRPRRQSVTAEPSVTSTPQVQSRAASSTPVARPVKRSDGPLVAPTKKRRTTETSKPNPKRVKAGAEPPPPVSSTSAPSKSKADVPTVKVEHRRAIPRLPSLDNSGELILELATPVTEKPPKQPSAMALALSGQLGQGPISLHSAASSPASRIPSPNPSRPEGMEEGEEFDLGGSSSPEVPVKPHGGQQGGDYFSGQDENDADADVEDFELPSPAQTHGRRKSVGAATVATGDEDDDLEQQMMAAMADDDDDGVAAPPPPPVESDEESEEE